MLTIDYIFIGILIIAALLGFVIGFGCSFKLFAKGIVGIIVSIFVCFMFGGMLKNIDVISGFIESIDNYMEGLWGFLKYLHLGTVIFYIILFIVIRIAWSILVSIFCNILEINNPIFKIINKLGGAIFLCGFIFGLCLLGLALLKFFENSQFSIDMLKKIEGGFLWRLYNNNPIKI